MSKIKSLILIVIIILSSGCVGDNSPDRKNESSVPTTTISAPADATSRDKETIQRLESRINDLESRVSELNDLAKYNGMMKQSSKNILPYPPFEVTVHFKKNMSYLFKQDGVVEMTYKDIIPIKASYEIFYNNNTIKIYPKNGTAGITFTDNEFDFYWLRFFDDYAVSTYENGWVEWAAKYDIRTGVTSKWEEIKK